eukprot:COSAG01_NODE_22904_length_836_cov_1.416554_1_plen_220_part_01
MIIMSRRPYKHSCVRVVRCQPSGGVGQYTRVLHDLRGGSGRRWCRRLRGRCSRLCGHACPCRHGTLWSCEERRRRRRRRRRGSDLVMCRAQLVCLHDSLILLCHPAFVHQPRPGRRRRHQLWWRWRRRRRPGVKPAVARAWCQTTTLSPAAASVAAQPHAASTLTGAASSPRLLLLPLRLPGSYEQLRPRPRPRPAAPVEVRWGGAVRPTTPTRARRGAV